MPRNPKVRPICWYCGEEMFRPFVEVFFCHDGCKAGYSRALAINALADAVHAPRSPRPGFPRVGRTDGEVGGYGARIVQRKRA